MRSSSNLYFSRLDHLRFVAALLVLAWHTVHGFIPPTYVPRYWPLSILEEGHTGVALFMVLSGFVFMCISRGKEIVYADFLRNRLLRIAPLFLFWLFLQLYLEPGLNAVDLVVAVLSLTNRAGVVPNVGWTIIVEFQFYLLFPFLVLFFRRYGTPYLLGVLALGLTFRALAWWHLGSVQELAYSTLFGRIDQFILGMIASEAFLRYEKFLSRPWLLVVVLSAWLLLVHRFNKAGGFYPVDNYPSRSVWWIVIPTLEGLFYGLLTACWLACSVRLPLWLDDGLAWLGKLSFSFYLNHMLVIKCCVVMARSVGVIPATFGTALLFCFGFVLPVLMAVSSLTYYFIEAPFLSLRRNYTGARPEPKETPPAETRLAA